MNSKRETASTRLIKNPRWIDVAEMRERRACFATPLAQQILPAASGLIIEMRVGFVNKFDL
jgi:hypothetical protein